MIFLERMKKLVEQFPDEQCQLQENVALYGLQNAPPPLAKHLIFSPMSDALINHLFDSYRGTIPRELETLYRGMNGADLFWFARYNKVLKFPLAFSRLSIYGIPLSSRQKIEPFNISVEDLNRPKGTPQEWIKFASYLKTEYETTKLDLFVDSKTSKVFALERDAASFEIRESWDSIDQCLCSILDSLV